MAKISFNDFSVQAIVMIRCWFQLVPLIFMIILFALINVSLSQSTELDKRQSCNALVHCLNPTNIQELVDDRNQLKLIVSRLRVRLEGQQNQISDLQNQLDSALNGCLGNNHVSSSTTERATTITTKSTTTTATESAAITTITGSHPISHLITVIPDILGYVDFVLFGGKLYSPYLTSDDRLLGLNVHNALTGSFIERVATPSGDPPGLDVCHRKSQIYMTIEHPIQDIWYANILQLEPNSDASWQKLKWFEALQTSESVRKRPLWYFALSSDCEEIVFLKFGSSELQIRRLSDGELLTSRDEWTERIHFIVGTNQRYYFSQSDESNVNGYVVEYDHQLEEVRRIEEPLPDTENNGTHYRPFSRTRLALHEDGGIFVSNGRVILLWPDFTSFVEIGPIYDASRIYYDPQLKLLGAFDTMLNVNVYNITLG